MTIGIVAIELYPVMWLLFVAVLSFLFFFVSLVLVFLCSITTYPLINELTIFISKVFSSESAVRVFIEQGRKRFMLQYSFHTLGAAIVAICAVSVWDWHSNFILQHPSPIRWVAYFSDYQTSNLYPGVSKNKHLRLHENGVVSYAEPNGWDVKITVETVDEKL